MANGVPLVATLGLNLGQLKQDIDLANRMLANLATQKIDLSVLGLQGDVTVIKDVMKKLADGTELPIKKILEVQQAIGRVINITQQFDKDGQLTGSIVTTTNNFKKMAEAAVKAGEAARKALSSQKSESLADERQIIASERANLTSTGLTRVTDLKALSQALSDIINKYKLKGQSLRSIQADIDSYNREINRLIRSEDQAAEASSRRALTQQRSNSLLRDIMSVQTSYSTMTSTGKDRIRDLRALYSELQNVTNTYNLQGRELTNVQRIMNSYIAEINRLKQAEKSAADARQQQRLQQAATLAQTQNQQLLATLPQSQTQLIGQNTLGSGDARAGIMNKVINSMVYRGAYMAQNAMLNAGSQVIRTNKEMENSLVQLSRVIENITDKDLTKYKDQIMNLSQEFALPFETTQQVFINLAKAGVQNQEDLITTSRTILTELNTTDIKNQSQAIQGIVSTTKQMGLEFKSSMDIVDKWNKLSDKYVTQTSDYSDALQKTGASARALGIDIDHLNAMVTIIKEATGKTGDEIGTALRTLTTRILREDTIKGLRNVGIEVMKDAEHFKNFKEIIADLSVKLDEWGENNIKAQETLDLLGGAWRVNDIRVLVQGWDQLEGIATESANATGYSVAENAKALQTFDKQLEKLKATLQELFIAFGDAGLFNVLKGVTTGLSGMVGMLNQLPIGISRFGEIMLVLTAVQKSVQLATKNTFSEHIARWNVGLTQAIRQTRELSNATRGVGLLGDRTTGGFMGINPRFSLESKTNATQYLTNLNSIALATGDMVKQARVLGYTTSDVAKIQNALQTGVMATGLRAGAAARQMEVFALATRGAAIASGALSIALNVGLSIAITAVISGIVSFVSWIKDADKRQKEFLETSKQNAKATSDQIKGLASLSEEYTQLKAKEKDMTANTDERKRLLEIQTELVEKYQVTPSLINKEGQAFVASVDPIKARIEALKALSEEEQDALQASLASNYTTNIENIKDGQDKIDIITKKIEMFKQVAKDADNSPTGRAKLPTELIDSNKIRMTSAEALAEISKFKTEIININKEIEGSQTDIKVLFRNYADNVIKSFSSSGNQVSDIQAEFIRNTAESMGVSGEVPFLKAEEKIKEFVEGLKTRGFFTLASEYDKLKANINLGKDVDTSTRSLEVNVKAMHSLLDIISKVNPNLNQLIYTLKGSFNLSPNFLSVADITSKSNQTVSELVDTLSKYDSILNDVQSGQQVYLADIEKWRADIPDINKYVDVQNGLITVKIDLLEQEKKKQQETAIESLKSLKSQTEGTRLEIEKRLEMYKIEKSILDKPSGMINSLLVTNNNSDLSSWQLEQKLMNDTLSGQRIPQEDIQKIIEYKKGLEYIDQQIAKISSGQFSGKNLKSSNGLDETVNQAIATKDRYMDLNNVLDQTNVSLQRNKTLQDEVGLSQAKKIELLKEEVLLNQKLQTQSHNKAEELRKERSELVKSLSARGVKFDGSGDGMSTSNAQSIYNTLVNKVNGTKGSANKAAKESLDEFEKALKRFIAIQNDELPKLGVAWYGYGKAINDAKTKAIDETTKSITEGLKTQVDRQKEALDTDLKNFKDAQEIKKKALEDVWDTQDFNDDIAEIDKKITSVMKEIAVLSVATDSESRERIKELQKELDGYNKDKTDKQKKYSRDIIKSSIDAETTAKENAIQANKDKLDQWYKDLEVALTDQKTLLNGFYMDSNGMIQTVAESIKNFGDVLKINVDQITAWASSLSSALQMSGSDGSLPNNSHIGRTKLREALYAKGVTDNDIAWKDNKLYVKNKEFDYSGMANRNGVFYTSQSLFNQAFSNWLTTVNPQADIKNMPQVAQMSAKIPGGVGDVQLIVYGDIDKSVLPTIQNNLKNVASQIVTLVQKNGQ